MDLLMPEKTQGRALRNLRGVGVLLELLRWLVAERRMQPDTVVVVVDEFRDVGAEMVEIAILVRVDFLPLQRLHETLASCSGSCRVSAAPQRKHWTRTGPHCRNDAQRRTAASVPRWPSPALRSAGAPPASDPVPSPLPCVRRRPGSPPICGAGQNGRCANSSLSQWRGSPHGNALNVYGCVGDGLFHAADKHLFKYVGEPLGRRCSVVRLLQLMPVSQVAQYDTSNGRRVADGRYASCWRPSEPGPSPCYNRGWIRVLARKSIRLTDAGFPIRNSHLRV